MNQLLTVTAVLEATAGLGLIAVPSVVVPLLLGAEISGAGIPLSRVAGVALLALGVARGDAQSSSARAVITAMTAWCVTGLPGKPPQSTVQDSEP